MGNLFRFQFGFTFFVKIRWLPQTIVGIIGVSDPIANRTAPVFNSLISKLRLIVASGKIPTISPARKYRRAATKELEPLDRSTEMWCMPRISGPAIL